MAGVFPQQTLRQNFTDFPALGVRDRPQETLHLFRGCPWWQDHAGWLQSLIPYPAPACPAYIAKERRKAPAVVHSLAAPGRAAVGGRIAQPR